MQVPWLTIYESEIIKRRKFPLFPNSLLTLSVTVWLVSDSHVSLLARTSQRLHGDRPTPGRILVFGSPVILQASPPIRGRRIEYDPLLLAGCGGPSQKLFLDRDIPVLPQPGDAA